jgi:AmmeMemoRadiSam system protein A
MGEAPETLEALGAEDGAALTGLAVAAVRHRLLNAVPPGRPDGPAVLLAPGASFVTLERKGRLRGCIGSLLARRALYLDVVGNAERAMVDPRLPPVDTDDWPELDVSVSVLSAPEELDVADRDDLLARLRPGVDGLLLSDGDRRATFLPVVWEKLATPEQFLGHLLAKGGWPARGWPRGLSVSRYTAREFTAPAPREPLP